MPGRILEVESVSSLRNSDVVPRSSRSVDDAVRALEEVMLTADLANDRPRAAQARLELGRTLLGLEDPACRELLEDAGTMFEELEDAAAVVEIDALLRRAAIAIEECPRSFHGLRRR